MTTLALEVRKDNRIATLTRSRKYHRCSVSQEYINKGSLYYAVTIAGSGLGGIKFPERVNNPRFTKYDQLEMRINMAEASVADLKGEIRELKDQFARFQESVGEQLKQNFFLPLLAAGFKLPLELELKPKPDSLNVEALLNQAKSATHSNLQGKSK